MPAPKVRHILAMDGGGIYGLFTVLMLKELCLRDESFLAENDVDLFAGTSAGALTALMLASVDRPRDLVLSGKLESLFSDPRLYSKRPGLTSITSLMGVTSWTGDDDARDLLKTFFGDMKMCQLKSNTIICSFNLSGDINDGAKRRWKPQIFYSFKDDDPFAEMPVWEVAFGATAPVQWRSVNNGITDGGIFADNPIIPAITTLLDIARKSDSADQNHEQHQTADEEDPDAGPVALSYRDFHFLKGFRLLSLGVGNVVPYYGLSKFNLGYLSFNMLPTNIREKQFWPPIFHLMLEPSVEGATGQAATLLGNRFHRLDPPVLGYPIPPVLGAMYLSRFWVWRELIEKYIHKGMKDPQTDLDLQATATWIKNVWRQDTAEMAAE
ncbi:MAG: patatin-like phospholipase family protein [Rhodospirillaceae bacterium]